MCSITRSDCSPRISLDSSISDDITHDGLVIESLFKNTLSQEELFLLIESGIKFFLFQRGQIPLPYERLHVSTATRSLPTNTTNANTNTNKNGSQAQVQAETPEHSNSYSKSTYFKEVPSSTNTNIKLITNEPMLRKEVNDSDKDNHNDKDDDNGFVNGWKRIRMLKSQGKLKRSETLLARKYKKIVENEVLVRSIWTDVFMRLHSIFVSSPTLNITNLIIFFGPSIYNPKEMITFEIDPSLHKKFKGLTPEDAKNHQAAGSEDFAPTLRSFYRSLIMSPEYLEFTTKPLRSTCSHICILTSEMISDDSLRDKLVHVENFYTLHPEAKVSNYCASKLNMRKKRLKVSMTLKPGIPIPESVKTDVQPCDMSILENPISGQRIDFSNRGVINDFKDKTIPVCSDAMRRDRHDDNNRFCYQIPMRFRGISNHR